MGPAGHPLRWLGNLFPQHGQSAFKKDSPEGSFSPREKMSFRKMPAYWKSEKHGFLSVLTVKISLTNRLNERSVSEDCRNLSGLI